jgi:hypothetical protein
MSSEKPDLLGPWSSCCLLVTCKLGSTGTTYVSSVHHHSNPTFPVLSIKDDIYFTISLFYSSAALGSGYDLALYLLWAYISDIKVSVSSLGQVLLLACNTKRSIGIFMLFRVLWMDSINKCYTETSRLPLVRLHVSLPKLRNGFRYIPTGIVQGNFWAILTLILPEQILVYMELKSNTIIFL